mgnify:CR=1 FL=1|tara:strand:+ start:26 stop:496 length:471 start_codon:yes stop_codon:yes gene_type:complete
MTSAKEFFESIQPIEGNNIGVSSWILVDQEMVNNFASITGDMQFIHVDKERAAKESPFKGTIAHGFLVLSLASKFASDVIRDHGNKSVQINYGFDRVRFISPVLCGVRVRGAFSLQSVTMNKSNEVRQVYGLTIEIENASRPAVIADWIVLTIFDT